MATEAGGPIDAARGEVRRVGACGLSARELSRLPTGRTVARPNPAHDGGRLGAPADAELLEDVVDVVLDRRHLDAQAGGDLLVGESLPDEAEDLALAAGQQHVGRRRADVGRQRGEAAHEARRDAG